MVGHQPLELSIVVRIHAGQQKWDLVYCFMNDNTYQNRDPQLDTSGQVVGFYEREFLCIFKFF